MSQRRPRQVFTGGLLLAGVGAIIVSWASPWPAVLIMRRLFERQADETAREMAGHIPKGGIAALLNVQYGDGDKNTTMDVFAPIVSRSPLPAVVWIHGGGWISGSRKHVGPYARIIAWNGYVAVALNYTTAPEAIYPTALRELNSALEFLVRHAADYGIDPERIILAGDSAGAQLASQLANLVTNPKFARRMSLTPALSPEQLRGVVLNCGIYDVSGIPKVVGINGWGFRIALWAYLDKKDWSHTSGGIQMCSINYATADFPPTWISGGNGDALTTVQSKPFAARLTSLGVPVTSVFFRDRHLPRVPHEYQFHLGLREARAALASTVDFLGRVSA
jgi:acetyl esterase/lipase